jgi:Family of unknown function (DUF6335)
MVDREAEIKDDLEDLDDIGIVDETELPQEITESYGTGVHDQPGFSIGGRTMRDAIDEYNEVGPELSGGDIDAAWSQAEGTAEETVGGDAPTPDQDIVDDLGKAVGLEMDDKTPLWTTEALELRDDRRWELEPKSAEDYEEVHDT